MCQMGDIMSMLLFQTSRRQLHDSLRDWVEDIPKDTSDQAEKRRRDNLAAAERAARKYLESRGSWSD